MSYGAWFSEVSRRMEHHADRGLMPARYWKLLHAEGYTPAQAVESLKLYPAAAYRRPEQPAWAQVWG